MLKVKYLFQTVIKKRNVHATKDLGCNAIVNFENVKQKTRKTYVEMIGLFKEKDAHRRGHVEFVYAALRNMRDFDVHKDLEVYKAIIDVLPKGKFIPQNAFQAEFMHYPKQQQCAIDALEQMEDNGVMPDHELEDMLMNVFGKRGHPLRKLWRMMYWMPKFRNLSPWPVPNPPSNDTFELAKLAIARIAGADLQAKLSIYYSNENRSNAINKKVSKVNEKLSTTASKNTESKNVINQIENIWIVSSQSKMQKKLLNNHNPENPIYIEGPSKVWLRNKSVDYFHLRAHGEKFAFEPYDTDDVSNVDVELVNSIPKKIVRERSVHEQDDGIIYALCATRDSSKDSLLVWIKHLELDNCTLANCRIVFGNKICNN